MRVVPDIPAIHRRFDYVVPEKMVDAITIGSRVRVDLHGRRVAGWVVEVDVESLPGVAPKSLAVNCGAGPPAAVIGLAEWATWRWAGPLSSFLGTASPLKNVRAMPPTSGWAETQLPSPGGESVAMVERALPRGAGPCVLRLAPTLDTTLVVQEVCHRLGTAGVLIIVPSRIRAWQLAQRLRRLGAHVALLPEQWEQAAEGHSIVVGTRAAAWAPLPSVTAVVVLDAHDEALVEERAPTWSAVDVVVERARRDSAPCLLVSSCPPVVLAEGKPLIVTSRAAERRGWPPIDVVDRRGDDPRTGLYSERLVRLLQSVLAHPHGRAVCILNRTGRARLLACGQCNALARCTRCGAAVTQPESAGLLHCGRCGEDRPPVCGSCDSSRLKLLRIGVARATEEISALLGVPAREVTAATPDGSTDGVRLVMGTEAALHRVARADAVVFVDFDQQLLAHRFGAGEESLAMLARAARLVGGETTGRVLVQTRLPDHEVLLAATQADPTLLSGPERELRHILTLPPWSALATVSGTSAEAMIERLTPHGDLAVSTLDSGSWLVKAENHQLLCDALASVPRPSGRLRVVVDPTNV